MKETKSLTKTNVFLCVTEYHVLLSILLATEQYSDIGYINRIILCNTTGRFNKPGLYDLTSSSNVNYQIYDKDYIQSKSFIKEMIKDCNGNMFLFNMNNPHFVYLLYRLKKTHLANTAFIQEGLASYNFQSYTLRQRISRIKEVCICLYKTKVFDILFYFFCLGTKGRFGKIFDYYDSIIDSSLVDNFFLSYPEDANYGKNKLKSLPSFSSYSRYAANKFFRYQQDKVVLNENDIVFIDQELEGSVELIKELSKEFPNSDIYVKLHPKTPNSWTTDYEAIPNVHVLNHLRGVPIELFLQNLHHIIIVTPFSSAMLIKNENCKCYYIYKWFIKNKYMKPRNLFVPGNSIIEVDKTSNIENFN